MFDRNSDSFANELQAFFIAKGVVKIVRKYLRYKSYVGGICIVVAAILAFLILPSMY